MKRIKGKQILFDCTCSIRSHYLRIIGENFGAEKVDINLLISEYKRLVPSVSNYFFLAGHASTYTY